LPHEIYPWWLAYAWDNPLRRLVHDPKRILGGLVTPGATVADIGCGVGSFSVAMAKMVGDQGRVIAVDVRPNMLKATRRRARLARVAQRIGYHQCTLTRLNIGPPLDFALAFWMVHEIDDLPAFFAELRATLKPSARLLLVEPYAHVSGTTYEREVETARAAGFAVQDVPHIHISRAALLANK
jgi:ubiquinone/menaquinone biosynthesis C-methylase UbiE